MNMEDSFAPFLALTSTVLTFAWIRRRSKKGSTALATAVQTVAECLGAALAFFVVNIAAGAVLILAVRSFTPLFIPLYVLGDLVLVAFSLLQGFVFQIWYRYRFCS
jgi:hypothetical protein